MASLSADDGSSGAVVTLTLTRVAVARLLVAVAPLLVAVPPLLADRGVHDVVAPSNRLGMTAIRVGSATSAATTATVRGFTGAILRYGAEVRGHGSPSVQRGETTLVAPQPAVGSMVAALGGQG